MWVEEQAISGERGVLPGVVWQGGAVVSQPPAQVEGAVVVVGETVPGVMEGVQQAAQGKPPPRLQLAQWAGGGHGQQGEVYVNNSRVFTAVRIAKVHARVSGLKPAEAERAVGADRGAIGPLRVMLDVPVFHLHTILLAVALTEQPGALWERVAVAAG